MPQPADGYAGDVSAEEAWEMLQGDAVLVDVRTPPEWAFVGTPELGELGKELVLVPWQMFPTMQPNEGFAEQIQAQGVTPDKTVLFICRSGGRSAAAAQAMTAVGYANCYNVLGGFEGPHDAERHRGTVDGWKAKGLPWTQQ